MTARFMCGDPPLSLGQRQLDHQISRRDEARLDTGLGGLQCQGGGWVLPTR
jgi:hypothetical protein